MLPRRLKRQDPKTRPFSRPSRGCALAFCCIRSALRPLGPHRHPVPVPRPAFGEGRQTRPVALRRSLPCSVFPRNGLGELRAKGTNSDVLRRERVAAFFRLPLIAGQRQTIFIFLLLAFFAGVFLNRGFRRRLGGLLRSMVLSLGGLRLSLRLRRGG